MRAPAPSIAGVLLTAASMFGGYAEARADTAETKVALIVGNSKYAHAPELSNPGNDAVAVADALSKIGFKVTVKKDATEQDFGASLKEFARDATKSDVALFYFAGHGVQYANENYFLPVDTKLADINDIEFDTIPMDLVVKAANKAHKVKIIILDACRADPTDHGQSASRSPPEIGISAGFATLHTINNADGMIVFYSAEAGQEALDGQGSQNSPFAQSLVKHIVESNAKIQDVFQLVSNDVKAGTKLFQHPTIALDETTTPVILNPAETAEDVWLRIHKSNNPDDFRQFIKGFPDTPQADDAQRALDYLDVKKRDAERDAVEQKKKAEEEKAKQRQAELEQEQQKKLAAEQDRLNKEKAEKEARDKAEAEKRAQIEADRKADEERIAEDKRKWDAAAAEHTRQALEKAARAEAEAKRLADEASAAKQKLAAEADAASKEEERRNADEAARKALEAQEAAKKEDERQKQQAMLEDQERKKKAAEAAAKVIADACERDQARIAELKDAGESAAIQRLGSQSICPAAPAAANQAIKDIAASQARQCAADQKTLSGIDQKNEGALKDALNNLKCDAVRQTASLQIARLDEENLRSAQICADEHAKLAAIDLFVEDSRASLSALKRTSQCAPLGAEVDSAIAEVDKRVSAAQTELERVGCYLPKGISGRFDEPTVKALTDYLKARHATNIDAPKITPGFVEELTSQDFVVCSAPVVAPAPGVPAAPTASISPAESSPAPAHQRVWARPEPAPARIPLIKPSPHERRNDAESGPPHKSAEVGRVPKPETPRPAAPKPAAPNFNPPAF
jgi:Caspase domain